jgi:hypothetical protein
VPSQAEIQCECAFTYMNAVFRKNLTDALAVDANDVDTASDTGGALNDGRDRARFCRTTATCIWGVSDPEHWARDRDRGVAEGVAHAPDVPSLLPTAADCDTGGTERRPLTPHRTRRLRRTSRNPSRPALDVDLATHALINSAQEGEHCSRVCVPPSPLAAQVGIGATRWVRRRSGKASELESRLLTGLAESYRERPLIWSELVL